MDVNYLLHREQVSLMMARHVHRALALGYGAKLRDGGFPHRIPIAWPIATPSENPDRGRAAA